MKIKKFKEYNEGLFSKKQNLEGFKVGDKIIFTKGKYNSDRVARVAEILHIGKSVVTFKIARGLPFSTCKLNIEDFSMRHATPEDIQMSDKETQRFREHNRKHIEDLKKREPNRQKPH